MLEQVFLESLEQFFSQETTNILSGVAERNLCGRLAMYLEASALSNNIKGYYADPEYNRKQGGKVKTIIDDELKIVTINCDLILHSRGEIMSRDNLIAIEMKKTERPESEKISDRARLRTMTKPGYGNEVLSYDRKTHPEHVCGYELGYFIEIDKDSRAYILQKFCSGKLISTNSYRF